MILFRLEFWSFLWVLFPTLRLFASYPPVFEGDTQASARCPTKHRATVQSRQATL